VCSDEESSPALEKKKTCFILGDVKDMVEMEFSIPFTKARRNPPLGGSGSPTLTVEGDRSI
jgi:hypothetical protein